MRKFEISDQFTIVDIGLKVENDSLEELFVGAAEGMFSIIIGGPCKKEIGTTFTIELQAQNREQLLIDWLAELLFRFDGGGLIPLNYRIIVKHGGDFFAFRKYRLCQIRSSKRFL